MTANPTFWLSPSLAASSEGTHAAYELKFVVDEARARELSTWACTHLQRDPHSDGESGYLVTSLYLDTPARDVLLRSPGFDVHKYRLRRYGFTDLVFAERKSKKNGRVWKQRADIVKGEDHWFQSEVKKLQLAPVCRVSYERLAFHSGDSSGYRLTLDRNAFGVATSDTTMTPVRDGTPLLQNQAIVEFKFLAAIPAVFKEVIERLQLAPTTISKYRRCARATDCFPRSADA